MRLSERARAALAERAWLDLADKSERRRADAMFEDVEAQLSECAQLIRTVTLAPKRGHRIKRLRVVLTAQRALVRAIEDLDEWAWDWGLSAQIDQDRCPLPHDPKSTTPLVPIAVTELGEATEAAIEDFRKWPSGRESVGSLRDDCIKALARAFHEAASRELDPAAYRAELIGQPATRTPGFVAIALRAARLPVPEPRKIWARIPAQFREKKVRRTKK